MKRFGCTAAVMGMAGLLLVSGCSGAAGGGSKSPDKEPTEKATGPAAGRNRGFDECSLVTPSQMRKLLGDKGIVITERAAHREGDSWQTTCGYDDGRVGLALNTVTVTTEVDPEKFEPFSRPDEPEPEQLDGLGDQAWFHAGPGFGKSSEVRVQVLDGTTSILLRYFAPDQKQQDSGTKAAVSVVRKALARLPENIEVEPGKPQNYCTNIDRKQAGEVLGEKLPIARTTVAANGDVSCVFAGEEARLEVSIWSRLNAEKYIETRGAILEGIGDAAVFSAQGLKPNSAFDATIRIGDRIIDMRGTYHSDKGTIDRAEPSKGEQALLKSTAAVLRFLTKLPFIYHAG